MKKEAQRRDLGMTLVEVVIALSVLVVIMTGVLSALIFAHRTTQESIDQNAAFASVRSTMEQIRAIPFATLPYTDPANSNQASNLYLGNGTILDPSSTARDLTILFNGTTPVTLSVSVSDLPTLTAVTPSTAVPTGTEESTVNIDINNTASTTSDDVNLRLWLWVQDISNTGVDATQVRAITLVYHWRYKDANKVVWRTGVMRNMRSAAPTF